METGDLARTVASRLRAAGHKAYLVGGSVRDLLLGVAPKDFDISTDARPERLLSLFPGSGTVGAHFGVVLVREGAIQVEVATFRSDREYADGRRPTSVDFETDPRADVLRRDFTVNGLMMDPETGEVLDFVGGRRDLGERMVRAIGDPEARFAEDHLRLLRAVRFAARLGFDIEAETWAAMERRHALILKVAPERVRDELERILTQGGARRGFELLDASGLLAILLPEVAAMKGVAQPPEFHPEGDVWTHTLLLLENLRDASPALAWGALLHDVGKPPAFRLADRIRFDGHAEEGVRLARGILGRLRASREETEQVEALVANHMRFLDVGRMKESTLKRFLRQPNFDRHLELHRLDCVGSNGRLEGWEFCRRRLAELGEEQLKPKRLLTGADLIAAGYTPGPRFAEMLDAVEDAQLDGRVASPVEAMAWVRQRYPLAS
ncbi:MAG: CCA tRNA nucleotidyltransferase [Bryobacteraceae bacterium]